MSTTRRTTPQPIGLTLFFPLLLGLAACAAGAPATSSEAAVTASPEPSPTQPPLDVAEEFAAKVEGLDSLVAELSGTLRIGDMEGDVSGELVIAGSDLHSLTAVTFPGSAAQETESISVGGIKYERTDTGYWLQLPKGSGGGGAGEDPVTAALANTEGLEVVGTEEHGGETLHRIQSSGLADLPPEALGVTDPTITDFEAQVAFLAEDDGTLAGINITASWVQGSVEAPVEAEFDLFYLAVNRDATVEAPADPWMRYQSAELGYQMDHPANWDVTHEPETPESLALDLFLGPVDGEVQVYRYTDLADVTANQWFRDSATVLVERFASDLELNIVSLPNGLEVHVFGGHYTDGGTNIFFQQGVVFGGDVAWDLDWYSLAGNEAEDQAQFLQFVMSFGPSAE